MPQDRSNNSVQIGFYNVPQRPIIKKNLDVYAKAMDNLYEQHREAIKQRSAIDVALSQIELDSSEDEWKYNYARNIRDQIDRRAAYGDYSGALDTATMLASSALSNPELIGRQKAHKDREEQLQKVQARTDIDEDTKRAWELSNFYYYKDKTDSQGHIIGGSTWKANWNPVSHVDVVPELAKAVSLIAAEKRSSSSTTGGTTVKEDGTSSGGQKSSSSSYVRLTQERINKQLKDYIEANPQLKASILQEYNVNKILLKDLRKQLAETNDPDEQERLRNEIAMRQGNITNHNGIVTGDYMTLVQKKYGNIINNFAYNWTESSSTKITNIDNYVRGGGNSTTYSASLNPNTGRYDVSVTQNGTLNQNVVPQLKSFAQSLNGLNMDFGSFIGTALDIGNNYNVTVPLMPGEVLPQ